MSKREYPPIWQSMKENIALISEAIPHTKWLGQKISDISLGRASGFLPFENHLTGDSENHIIASGAVVAVIDNICGTAVMAAMEKPIGIATLDLRIDYLRPASPYHGVGVEAECYHKTENVAFVRAWAWDGEDKSRKIAAAQATFMLIKSRKGMTSLNNYASDGAQ